MIYFQTQQLPLYKEEMKKYLIEGLPVYDIKPLSTERINELLEKIEQDPKSENNKEILIKFLSPKIDER